MSQAIEIPISKGKTALLLIVPLTVLIVSPFSIVSPESFISPTSTDVEKIKMLGIGGLIVGVILTVLILRKWLTKKTGLTIDQSGITDFSNASYTGLVEWKDITGVEGKKVGPIKLIILHTNQPEKYINQAKKTAIRQLRKNHSFYGSPLMIVSTRLKIKYDDLLKLINSEFQKIQK